MHRCSARTLLDKLEREGVFKSALFRVNIGTMRRAVRFYWPVNPGKTR